MLHSLTVGVGDLCGSSFLNEAFREHLRARLEGEDYLEVNSLTIESIIDSQVILFENDMKRSADVTAPNIPTEFVFIQGLRANPHLEKRFLNNRLKIERSVNQTARYGGCADNSIVLISGKCFFQFWKGLRL
jgi:hypothetical protein